MSFMKTCSARYRRAPWSAVQHTTLGLASQVREFGVKVAECSLPRSLINQIQYCSQASGPQGCLIRPPCPSKLAYSGPMPRDSFMLEVVFAMQRERAGARNTTTRCAGKLRLRHVRQQQNPKPSYCEKLSRTKTSMQSLEACTTPKR